MLLNVVIIHFNICALRTTVHHKAFEVQSIQNSIGTLQKIETHRSNGT